MVTRRERVTTGLTVIFTGAWMAQFVIRYLNGQAPTSPALDSVVVLIVAYWFATSAFRKNGTKNGETV